MPQTGLYAQEPTALNLVTQNRTSRNDSPFTTMETDMEQFENDNQELKNFIANRQNQFTNTNFFSVNGTMLKGGNKLPVRGGAIPIFNGAALDLSSARLTGEKRFFRAPTASGSGGLLTILPQNLDNGIVVPLTTLHLEPDHIVGTVSATGNVGFGNANRLHANQIFLHDNVIQLHDVTLKNIGSDDECKYHDVFLDEQGFSGSEEHLSAYLSAVPTETTTAETTPVAVAEPEPLTKNIIRSSFPAGKLKFYGFDLLARDFSEITIEEEEGEYRGIITFDGDNYELSDISKVGDGQFNIGGLTLPHSIFTGSGKLFEHFCNFFSAIDPNFSTLNETLDDTQFPLHNLSMKDGNLICNMVTTQTDLTYAIFDTSNSDAIDPEFLDQLKNFIAGDRTVYEEEEEENTLKKGAVNIPILAFPLGTPFITIGANVYGKYETGFSISPNIQGTLGKPANMKDALENDGIKLSVTAAVTGEAKAGVSLDLTAGIIGVATLSGVLGAELALGGAKDNLMDATAAVTIKKRKGESSYFFSNADIEAQAGIALKGQIVGRIEGRILLWSNTLFECTFKEWELAAIEGHISASKDFEHKRPWVFHGGASYQAITSSAGTLLSKKESIEQMTAKNNLAEFRFKENQNDFKELYEQFNQLKNTLARINTNDTVTITPETKESMETLTQAFCTHYIKIYQELKTARDLVERFSQDQNTNISGLTQRVARQTENMESLNTIKQQLTDNPKTRSLGLSSMEQFRKKADKTSADSTQTFSDNLHDQAAAHIKTLQSLLIHEEKMYAQYAAPYEKKKRKCTDKAKELGLDVYASTKSNTLTEFYKERNHNFYKEYRLEYADLTAMKSWQENRHNKEFKGKSKLTPSPGKTLDMKKLASNSSATKEALPRLAKANYLAEFIRSVLKVKDTNLKQAILWQFKMKEMETLKNKSSQTPEDKATLAKYETEVKSELDRLKTNDSNFLTKTASKEDLLILLKKQLSKLEFESFKKKKITTFEEIQALTNGTLTLQHLIDYEENAVTKATRSNRSKHQARLDILKQRQGTLNSKTAGSPDHQLCEYQCVKEYFHKGDETKAKEKEAIQKEGFLDELRAGKHMSLLSFDDTVNSKLESFHQDQSPVYRLYHQYAKTADKTPHAMHEDMNAHLQTSRTADDYNPAYLVRYYDYMAHQENRTSDDSDKLTLYTDIKNILGSSSDSSYDDALDYLSKHEQLENYRKFLLDHCDEFLTPEMFKETSKTERSIHRSQTLLDLLTDATTNQDPETVASAQESFKSYIQENKLKFEEDTLLSLNDILEIENKQLGLDSNVKKHLDRIATLKDTSKSEQERLDSYEGKHYSINSDKIKLLLEEQSTLFKDFPEAELDALFSYQTGQLDLAQTDLNKITEEKANASKRLELLVYQANACRTIANNMENALSNPTVSAVLSTDLEAYRNAYKVLENPTP